MADTEKIDEKKQMQVQLKQIQNSAAKSESGSDSSKSQSKEQTQKSAETAKNAKPEQEEQKKELKVLSQTSAVAPLSDAYKISRSHRTRMAISILRKFAAKHAKTVTQMVKISPVISELINARGSRNPPKKIKITIKKLEDQSIFVDSAEPVKKKIVREKPVSKKKPVENKQASVKQTKTTVESTKPVSMAKPNVQTKPQIKSKN